MTTITQTIPVALIGATGVVGQKTIALLENHPYLQVEELIASKPKAGQRYSDSIKGWFEQTPLDQRVGNLQLIDYEAITSPYVISALPAEEARVIEPCLAEKGHYVFSNASAFRMDPAVPLLIPEINPDHLSLLDSQKTTGKIITNPNCAVVFAALALAPLCTLGAIEHVSLFTMQAVSGAGYPGVSSMDILGNIIPFIPNEEEKLSVECQKILGSPTTPASFTTTVNANRVPVLHNHTVILHVQFGQKMAANNVVQVLQETEQMMPDVYKVYEEGVFPTPQNLDVRQHSGVHISRIKQDRNPNAVSLIAMGHNLVRGAAGAAIKNLESFLAR